MDRFQEVGISYWQLCIYVHVAEHFVKWKLTSTSTSPLILSLTAGCSHTRREFFDQVNNYVLTISACQHVHVHVHTKGSWCLLHTCMCIFTHTHTLTHRLSLPAEWCGLRDEQLSQVSGVPGCVFAHANSFIGGNLTYERALSMAQKTLQLVQNPERPYSIMIHVCATFNIATQPS